MPSTFFGLPTHVLIVHAVVVLLPLAAVMTVVVAVWPWARRRIGVLTVIGTFFATLTVPLATSSGEGLVPLVAPSPLVARHVALGHQLVPFAALLGLALAGVVGLDLYRRAVKEAPGSPAVVETWAVEQLAARTPSQRLPRWVPGLAAAMSVLAVLLAVGTLAEVVRIGHSGAQASWSGRTTAP